MVAEKLSKPKSGRLLGLELRAESGPIEFFRRVLLQSLNVRVFSVHKVHIAKMGKV